MELEGIMLSEISQRKTNTVWYHLYVESKKIQQTSVYNKKEADTDIENKPVVTSGEGKYRSKKRLIMGIYEIMCVKLLKL